MFAYMLNSYNFIIRAYIVQKEKGCKNVQIIEWHECDKIKSIGQNFGSSLGYSNQDYLCVFKIIVFYILFMNTKFMLS